MKIFVLISTDTKWDTNIILLIGFFLGLNNTSENATIELFNGFYFRQMIYIIYHFSFIVCLCRYVLYLCTNSCLLTQ